MTSLEAANLGVEFSMYRSHRRRYVPRPRRALQSLVGGSNFEDLAYPLSSLSRRQLVEVRCSVRVFGGVRDYVDLRYCRRGGGVGVGVWVGVMSG